VAEQRKSLISQPIRAELIRAYSASDRHYHDLRHIEAMLALMDEHRLRLFDPICVEASIWFHDAIYDTHRSDNETRSAALARARLCDSADEDQLGRVATMICATSDHRLPDFRDQRALGDCALFLDMDLAILGSSQPEFAAYERAVRLEYAWVEEEMWIAGRRRVLEGFLARQSIYASAEFRSAREGLARANIMRALEALAR
jgi:predicted metal-dependent HD superfamily phosphohydrolase